jgi:integration host factor subunit alpha
MRQPLELLQDHKTATRVDLFDAIYRCCPMLSRKEARLIFECALQEISIALISGENVKLMAFGNFIRRSKRKRVGRNPRTGIEFPISSRYVIAFRPSPLLTEQVNTQHNRDKHTYTRVESQLR